MMKRPALQRAHKTQMRIGGVVGDYLGGITDQWLLVAPKSNPGMLEMFRDRDASPLRQMVPWAGEFAGKYLTGAVQVLRTTNDPRLKAWLKEFVHRLVALQADDGYLGPWPAGHRLTNSAPNSVFENSTWDTWGHYHVMMGLMLWHEETNDKEALACATRIADCLCGKYLGKKKPRLVETGRTEMNLAPVHSLCILYRKTKKEPYLRMARQIVDEFGVKQKGAHLAGDYLEQPLTGKEFFETPKPRWESLHPIMGLVELYWITGEDKYRQAFEKTWWSIVKLDRHNNGGFSSGEQATGNPYHLAAIESCCTIAWNAMTVEMLKLTGNSVVADELELSLLNSVIGMHSSTGRWATYDTPMNGLRRASAHSISFQAREGTSELNCCSVNTSRGFGLLGDWGLMKQKDTLVLNYYGPSDLSATLKRGVFVTLTQETGYPVDGKILIRVKPSESCEFGLKLRIPAWSSKSSVRINGETVRGVKPGTYLTMTRRWKPGDRIHVSFDMSLRFWRGENECKGQTSVYRGPLLLAYDHRYNLQNAPGGKPEIHGGDPWKPIWYELTMPPLDARNMNPRRVAWSDWLPPLLLLEFKATNGKAVRLCDFGSAGEAGTPYRSWLSVRHAPTTPGFSRERPLRSERVQGARS